MLASNGAEMEGRGRRELGSWMDGSRGRKKKAGTLCPLGACTGDRRIEIKKNVGSVPDPTAEQSLFYPGRRATATTGPGP